MGGIGTRRWVKFSKYLIKLGYQVHILTVDYKFKDKTTWLHDIDEEINIYKFKSKYPLWLLSETNISFLKQVKRYSNFILKKLFFYLDIAQYDAKPILSQAKKIIDEYSIKNVIATGHPVSINYISSYLKIDNPNINLIQDYRDNWNDLKVYQYGSSGGLCFFKRKEKSAYQEFFTTFYADKVINVSDDLTKKLRSKHKSLSEKFLTLTNGYDVDDFKALQTSNNTFNMIYTGSLFNERIEAIYLLLDALIALDDDYINENLKIVIYSNYSVHRIDDKYYHLIEKNIFFKEFVPPEEIVKIIASFSYCLSINSKFASYAFGTKIFDYMALNKKIVHISNRGALYDLLEEQKQFVSNYDIENIKNILLKMKDDYVNNESKLLQNYSDFSLEKLTVTLEKLFI
jgi:glycosyltransferase involved in cell wall biosynthesis